MPRMRFVEHALPRHDDVCGATVVHVGAMQEREPDVVVLVVVPVVESPDDLTCEEPARLWVARICV